jgi:predicted DNA-binding transcriptional regulator YafY
LSLYTDFELSDTEEIKRWIMSFGQHALVLEPESLRTEIVQELNSLLGAYKEEPGRTPHRRQKAGPSR